MASDADPDSLPYAKFVQQILDPVKFDSFRQTLDDETVSDIHIHFHEDADNPDTITSTIQLDDMYPTQTVYDLQTRIFLEKGELNRYHPTNQSLLLKTPIGYTSFLHIFNNQTINVGNPILRIQADSYIKEFVLDGKIQYVKISPQERVTLYTKLLHKVSQKDVYEVHCFLFDDILSRYEGVRPLSPEEWSGRVKPFFPLRQEQQALDDMTTRVQRYMDRQTLMNCLETVLRDKGDVFAKSPKVTSFRTLRICWKPLPKSTMFEPVKMDTVFYSMPLSERIPYIRYFPKQGTPLSKVYVKGPLPIPVMDRPEILMQWAQEDSPVPEEDLVYCKVLLRSAAGSVPPLYATFFIFESGAGKFVVQPNKNEKSFSPLVELRELREILEYVTSIVPKLQQSPKFTEKSLRPRALFTPDNIVLEDAYAVFSMSLPSASRKLDLSQKTLKTILPFFLPLLQVTNPPIKEQNPLLFLRYKGTDNFLTQSRDFDFLKAIFDLQEKKGGFSAAAMRRYYEDEFDVTEKEATERVTAFMQTIHDYQVIDPETSSFTQVENSGIDMSIFGKHPNYTIHTYHVNNLYAFRTLLTLLIVIMNASVEDFGDDCIEAARHFIGYQTVDMQRADLRAAAKTEDVAKVIAEDNSLIHMEGEEAANIYEDNDEYFPDIGVDELPSQIEQPVVIAEMELSKTQQQKALDEMSRAELVGAADEEDDTALAATVKSAAELKQTPAKTYFSERLHVYDYRLFSYKKAPGVKQYPRMCSSTASRQPIAMSEAEYTRMRELYADDEAKGYVQFIDMPLKAPAKGEKYDTKYDARKTERITTLRYGTTGISNVYICSLYWCRKDELVVLKRDFEGEVDKKGNKKPKFTCPFCLGRLVTNRDAFVPGETVIERSVKDKGDKAHTFVQFLTTGQHPEGFSLPCCFVSDKPTYETDPRLHIQVQGLAKPLPSLKPTADPFTAEANGIAKPSIAEENIDEEEEIDKEGVEDSTTPLYKVNYPQRLEQMLDKKPYITGAEKFPLDIRRDGPQIGVLSKAQDSYFTQQSIPGLVKQHHTVWKLITDESKKGDKKKGEVAVSGFLRIAVDNRKRVQAESFLAAVAPIVEFNSTFELKTRIMNLMTFRFFLQLNYGNLLLEFYDPNFVLPGYSAKNPKLFLQKFIKEHLAYPIPLSTNTEEITRAAKSWYRFLEMFEDVDVVKEYRQFSMMFSYPGYFTDNGLVFIVLETDATGAVTVRCPPYGVSEAMAKRCDIAFLSFTPKAKLWEPIFYTKNNTATGEHTNTFIFRSNERDTWPSIVQVRADEFYRMCKSSGLGLYTDSPKINPQTLLPLSVALSLPLEEYVFLILRDTYNHVSAVVYALEDNQLVFVHVVDDGTPHERFRTDFDWETFDWEPKFFTIANADKTVSFYTDVLLPSIAHLGEQVVVQYTPKDVESGRFFKVERQHPKTKAKTWLYGMAFLGGLKIPVSPASKDDERFKEDEKVMSWYLDKKLVFGAKEAAVSMEMTPQEFQEVFQHLRLTFSNWFAFEASNELKEHVKEILFDMYGNTNSAISVVEKRKMLQVLLGPVVSRWLDSTTPVVGRQPSLQRVDCHLQKTSETCTNKCAWKAAEGQCVLHTAETVTLGNKQVPARDVLLARLFEELIRFPLRRDQLLKQKVSRYQKLVDSFRSGDEYIMNESMPSWTEFLRASWQKDTYEQPRFVEELAVGAQLIQDIEEEAPIVLPVLPKVLEPLFQGKRTITFFPGNVLELLGDLHINLFTFFQKTDATLNMNIPTSLTQIQEIAQQLQHSLAFIQFEEGNPILKQDAIQTFRVKLGAQKSQPYFIFVLLPTGETGVLSASPTEISPIDASNIAKTYKYLFGAGSRLLSVS